MAAKRRRIQGTVISNRMDKSIVVEAAAFKRHPLYKKSVRGRKRFMAHDPDNQCRIGDVVLIEASRPLSSRKHWRLREILKRPEISAEEEAPSIDTATV